MGNKKINYFDIFLGIILNILVVIAAILIYNAYIVSPKLNSNSLYNDNIFSPTESAEKGINSTTSDSFDVR